MANEQLVQVQTKSGSAWYNGEAVGQSIKRQQLDADVAETGLSGDGDGDDDNPDEPGGFLGNK